ncbi:formyltransferase family protein [Aeromonas veronii]|uniref:formyltransferase family protein n=1 Tax=Aeromonas veronii TaxID=654 RepID=UPI00226CBFC7|nr:formyltransferase family protein [Aeromonas veronii]MCX9103495.1 formyltransferase family protein [Aeromonas veronii]MCX9119146.1 formyltransferase family protein [Aeromonas veronii]
MLPNREFVMLCARTARSSAYVQALAVAGIVPAAVIIYGQKSSKIHTRRQLDSRIFNCSIWLPDLSLELESTLTRLGWSYLCCDEIELGSESLHSILHAQTMDLLVYSGYGGQIVPASILNLTKVLHIHSGWLPDYRGSTTLYYQMLDQQHCAASAIYLDENIDTGPILLRKTYPLPPKYIDIDYLYDNAIRADLLVDYMRSWITGNNEYSSESQVESTQSYYIIHPLLKHIALSLCDKEGNKYE